MRKRAYTMGTLLGPVIAAQPRNVDYAVAEKAFRIAKGSKNASVSFDRHANLRVSGPFRDGLLVEGEKLLR